MDRVKAKKLGKQEMMEEIMLSASASGYRIDGDVFFALAFRTESELRQICRELHIKVDCGH
jgi:hypothetical protein